MDVKELLYPKNGLSLKCCFRFMFVVAGDTFCGQVLRGTQLSHIPVGGILRKLTTKLPLRRRPYLH